MTIRKIDIRHFLCSHGALSPCRRTPRLSEAATANRGSAYAEATARQVTLRGSYGWDSAPSRVLAKPSRVRELSDSGEHRWPARWFRRLAANGFQRTKQFWRGAKWCTRWRVRSPNCNLPSSIYHSPFRISQDSRFLQRGHSSVGRAPALQAGSQGFESPCLQIS